MVLVGLTNEFQSLKRTYRIEKCAPLVRASFADDLYIGLHCLPYRFTDVESSARKPLFVLQICAKVETMKSSFELVIYETSRGRQPFSEWLDSLDGSVRGKVEARVDRLMKGQFGNSKALKDGVFELKFKNPAFRIYYAMIKRQVVLLISGGDKSRQSDDIKEAKICFQDYRSRYENEKES
jgi:putative addiction module killer protein